MFYDDFDESVYSSNVLNGIKSLGFSIYKLVLKFGVPDMLLINIDQKCGLCSGTRLLAMGDHVIEAKIISRTNIGTHIVFITKMTLMPSYKRILFKFQRK